MSNPTSTTSLTQSPTTTTTTTTTTTSRSTTAKRQKHHQPDESLLQNLPDDISQLILSLVPPSTLFSVCHSWRRLIYSPSFPPFLSLYALLFSKQTQLQFSSFDPISSKWTPLPPPPPNPHLRFRHPSFISRNLPIQSLSVSNNLLVLLAASADHFLPALTRPLVFNPFTRKWSHGPPLHAPRRWCAAGASGGVVYVASGIGSHYNTDVARSVEKWDVIKNVSTSTSHQKGQCPVQKSWRWEKMGKLKDGKFSREAIEAVGWRGKLCMVNVKGDVAKEGVIYDVERDVWEGMPEGMLAGWKGPAAAMEEEILYVVDESKGLLKRYDDVKDDWVVVVERCALFKGAEQVVAAGGRVCVLCGDGFRIAVVDVATPAPGKVWVVDVPSGSQAVTIHVLPRVSCD